MANISRDTFDVVKKYVKLILQQGVPWVDADFNEMQDVQRDIVRKVLKYTAGDGTPDNGFRIMENSIANGGTGDLDNKFLISMGHYFSDGVIGWLPSLQEYNLQSDWITWDGAGEPSPQVPFVSTPPVLAAPVAGSRTDNIILCLWENEVDGVEDPNIIDPTILTETCRRAKQMAFVYVSPDPVPVSSTTHKFSLLATINRVAGKDSIETADITDTRLDINQFLNILDETYDEVVNARNSFVYGAAASLDVRIEAPELEIQAARGSLASVDARLDVSLENNGDLKLEVQEAAVSKKTNTQTMNFDHGLDVTDSGGKVIRVDIDESELNANLIPNVPAGKIAAVTVQAALNELDNEKIARDGTQELTADWDVGNFNVRAKQFTSDVATGTSPLLISSATKVDTLNVDQVDGVHLPGAIASVLSDHNKAAHDALAINADKVDGVDLPATIASVLTDHNKAAHDALNINADQVDSQHGSYYLARGNHTGTQAISTLSDHNKTNHDALNINADTLDTYHAGNATGQIPVSNGTLNTNLNSAKLGGYTAEELIGIGF